MTSRPAFPAVHRCRCRDGGDTPRLAAGERRHRFPDDKDGWRRQTVSTPSSGSRRLFPRTASRRAGNPTVAGLIRDGSGSTLTVASDGRGLATSGGRKLDAKATKAEGLAGDVLVPGAGVCERGSASASAGACMPMPRARHDLWSRTAALPALTIPMTVHAMQQRPEFSASRKFLLQEFQQHFTEKTLMPSLISSTAHAFAMTKWQALVDFAAADSLMARFMYRASRAAHLPAG